jgi:hypothetical protein
MSTALTYTHLHFELAAQTPVRLGGYQGGERLRNALASVLLQATCPENPRRKQPTPEHAAVCPACWLLAAEVEPGEVRRAYSLVPPLILSPKGDKVGSSPPDMLAPGDVISFTLTLFGSGLRFLPYFVLAVPQMAWLGVGPGRGSFTLRSIQAIKPLSGTVQSVLAEGENVVHAPDLQTTWQDAHAYATQILKRADNRLRLRFLTPTRLTADRALVKVPDFGVFFRRLLERLDELGYQYAQQPSRSRDEIQSLYALADGVHLVDTDVRWIDIFGWSNRKEGRTPMGGFVGSALYRSNNWETLLPWLVFAQGVQVGKLTVKGNGVYEIVGDRDDAYWTRG